MIAWTEEQLAFRHAVRRFVESEIAPRREELEFGDLPPYDLLRSFYRAFDLGAAAAERFERSLSGEPHETGRSAAETILPIIEISRYSPGLVAALGVSTSLTAGAILRAGDTVQKKRWARDLLTLDKVGSWALPSRIQDLTRSVPCSPRPARRETAGY